MEFQHETNTLPFLVLKTFWWHYKSASLRLRNVQRSFARWNAENKLAASVGTQMFLLTQLFLQGVHYGKLLKSFEKRFLI